MAATVGRRTAVGAKRGRVVGRRRKEEETVETAENGGCGGP
jgi:hypothetical protein